MRCGGLGDRVFRVFAERFSERAVAVVASAMGELAGDSRVQAEAPDVKDSFSRFLTALDSGDPSDMERTLVELYGRLHSAGAKYSKEELHALKARSGYSCISGGIAPLVKAEPFITPEAVVADLGAGNGLQGLLLQRIRPHRRTLQIEISSEMIRVGRILQEVLDIGNDRVEWIRKDIADACFDMADFIYLYRPVRPQGSGAGVYEAIGRRLTACKKNHIIFSVADCLGQFLDESFSVLYSDGHLTCFVRGQRAGG